MYLFIYQFVHSTNILMTFYHTYNCGYLNSHVNRNKNKLLCTIHLQNRHQQSREKFPFLALCILLMIVKMKPVFLFYKPVFKCCQSVSQSCLTLCDPMNHSTPGLPVHHQLPEFTQTHAHWVGDAIQPSHPLSSPSPPAPNPSQHQGLFQWVNSSHEVAKVLEFQLQHQSFQWTPRTDLP